VGNGKTSINKAYSDIKAQQRESGELKGAKTNALASDAKYNKALKALTTEIVFLKDDGWNQVSREKVLADLERLIESITQ
jgi:hypothetical protein